MDHGRWILGRQDPINGQELDRQAEGTPHELGTWWERAIRDVGLGLAGSAGR